MTKLQIIGNITKDVEIGQSESGVKYAHFTVASDRSRSKESATDFFRVSAIGDWVDDLSDLSKGTFVKVAGYLKTAEYNGRTQIEIVAKSVERAAKETAA